MPLKTSHNLIKITKLLSDGHFHTGTIIGEQLNISRAAVWKYIEKLRNYGIHVESSKGQGYRIEPAIILLNKKAIQKKIKHRNILLDVLEKIHSTNRYLLEQKSTNKTHICLTEMQTEGKGRLNRNWHSPFASNIYLSIKYSFQKDISQLSGLSLVIALATQKTLAATLKNHAIIPMVKWPNDVLIGNHKISGSLLELQAEPNGHCQAIIGIGININMTNASKKHINQNWTSLQNESSQYYDRNIICADLVNNVLDMLDIFTQQGLEPFLPKWQTVDYLSKKTITLSHGKNIIKGKYQGINALGHIIIKAGNTKRSYACGDASIVKK